VHIQALTIFPELFAAFLHTSLVGRAIERGLLTVDVHDLRDFTTDRHRVVDDEPYGGGGGMVMKAGPWLQAVNRSDLLLLCGRYEGIDERVRQSVVDEEISIGDFVVSGGEVPAMVLIEALSRQVPGVVGQPESVEQDSFRHGLLDHPHYTRPRLLEGLAVPEVLLSGDHAAIAHWRRREALRATRQKRPDLLVSAPLEGTDRRILEEMNDEETAPMSAAMVTETDR